MGRIERKGLIGWLKVKLSLPFLFEKVVLFLLAFLTTWLVEPKYFAATNVHTKKCNLLAIEKRGDLHLNQDLAVKLNKLIDRYQQQNGH